MQIGIDNTLFLEHEYAPRGRILNFLKIWTAQRNFADKCEPRLRRAVTKFFCSADICGKKGQNPTGSATFPFAEDLWYLKVICRHLQLEAESILTGNEA